VGTIYSTSMCVLQIQLSALQCNEEDDDSVLFFGDLING
jgi:hypothetical protein